MSPLQRAIAALSRISLEAADLRLELAAARTCEREAPAGVLEFYIQTPENRRAGAIELRLGDAAEHPVLDWLGQLGFVVHPLERGRGLARQASLLLIPLARASGMETMILTCSLENRASEKTILRLGATPSGEIEAPRVLLDHSLSDDGREKWRRRFILSLAHREPEASLSSQPERSPL